MLTKRCLISRWLTSWHRQGREILMEIYPSETGAHENFRIAPFNTKNKVYLFYLFLMHLNLMDLMRPKNIYMYVCLRLPDLYLLKVPMLNIFLWESTKTL